MADTNALNIGKAIVRSGFKGSNPDPELANSRPTGRHAIHNHRVNSDRI